MSSLLKRKCAVFSISLTLLFLTACQSPKIADNPQPETVISSTPPFQTKEPERYRANRTITIVTAAGETIVTKSSIAKDGEMRRNESETATKKVAYLDLPEGRFVLLLDEKVYADLASEPDLHTSEDEEGLEISPDRLLHSEAGHTSYQLVGAEVIAGRKANKYRIVVNSSGAGSVSPSETVIWIDEALSMPVRSETRSPEGARVTMELSDVTLEVEKSLFQVPPGYRKLAFGEFRKLLGKTD